MRRLKNWVPAVLRMLGIVVVLALILLLIEVLAGVFILEVDALFG